MRGVDCGVVCRLVGDSSRSHGVRVTVDRWARYIDIEAQRTAPRLAAVCLVLTSYVCVYVGIPHGRSVCRSGVYHMYISYLPGCRDDTIFGCLGHYGSRVPLKQPRTWPNNLFPSSSGELQPTPFALTFRTAVLAAGLAAYQHIVSRHVVLTGDVSIWVLAVRVRVGDPDKTGSAGYISRGFCTLWPTCHATGGHLRSARDGTFNHGSA